MGSSPTGGTLAASHSGRVHPAGIRKVGVNWPAGSNPAAVVFINSLRKEWSFNKVILLFFVKNAIIGAHIYKGYIPSYYNGTNVCFKK